MGTHVVGGGCVALRGGFSLIGAGGGNGFRYVKLISDLEVGIICARLLRRGASTLWRSS